MTMQQKLLAYLICTIAAFLFQWPAAIVVLMLFADFNGDLNQRT